MFVRLKKSVGALYWLNRGKGCAICQEAKFHGLMKARSTDLLHMDQALSVNKPKVTVMCALKQPRNLRQLLNQIASQDVSIDQVLIGFHGLRATPEVLLELDAVSSNFSQSDLRILFFDEETSYGCVLASLSASASDETGWIVKLDDDPKTFGSIQELLRTADRSEADLYEVSPSLILAKTNNDSVFSRRSSGVRGFDAHTYRGPIMLKRDLLMVLGNWKCS
ncbi:hypothetical protein OA084_00780, partial [Actinomycetota bacterium]|nr:hypothetical protein [Actinomycetota bacterium]